MKKTFKVLGYLFGLGAAILLGLHLFLVYGLTRMMNETILPELEQKYGLKIQVQKLSINIPNGMLYLKKITLQNPDGFLLENLASVDEVKVEVDLHSILGRKPLIVRRIEVEKALLNIIRNADGVFNLAALKSSMPSPPPPQPPQKYQPPSGIEQPAAPATPPSLEQVYPPPEILLEFLSCRLKVRYIDLHLNQTDIALDLGLTGSDLSTLQDPDAPWGSLNLQGSLGNQKQQFLTMLQARLAPLTMPERPSFDLTGKVMEIDPRLMEKLYKKLGIRSAPFGLEPDIHCVDGVFENSAIALKISNIKIDEKHANTFSRALSAQSLRFSFPLSGTVSDPVLEWQQALASSIGGNTKAVVQSYLQDQLAKHGVTNTPPDDVTGVAVELLGNKVEYIGRSETAQRLLKDLAHATVSTNRPDNQSSSTNQPPAQTNAPAPPITDTLIDILGEEVDEVGENEMLKNELKGLGRLLFGN